MNTERLEQIAKELEVSPMFQLSLSSKELFHSNFLYWIWKYNPAAFKEIIEKLFGDNTKFDWSSKFIVEREKKKFDLSVWEENADKSRVLRLVIENKVKSIPRKKQLDDYKESIKKIDNKDVKFLLLSLSPTFPEMNVIKDWNIVNYKILAKAIKEVFCNAEIRNSTYEYNVICDYYRFIRHLHLIANEWNNSPESSWLDIPDMNIYRQLRISDLRQKLHAAYALSHLLDAFSHDDEKLFTDSNIEWEIPAGEIMKRGNDNTFYVNFGMTRDTGFFEIKVKIEDNTIFLIQVQGNQYRRAIERDAKYDENIAWLRNPQSPLHRFFTFSEGTSPHIKYNSSFESDSPFRHCKEPKQDGFCRFGNWFVYQYVKLNKNVKIKDLTDAIMADMKKLFK